MTPEYKKCSRCGHTRHNTEWNKHKNRSDGLSVYCKSCTRSYYKKWIEQPGARDKQRENALARYHRLSESEKEEYIRRGTKLRRERGYYLSRKYGLTLQDYEAILENQGGRCAICGSEPSNDRRFPVDHDHSCCPGEDTCGKCVRGILCVTCNSWLGILEKTEWTEKAWGYLNEVQRLKGEH